MPHTDVIPSALARSPQLSLLVIVNGNCSGIDRRAAGLLDLLRSTDEDADRRRPFGD